MNFDDKKFAGTAVDHRKDDEEFFVQRLRVFYEMGWEDEASFEPRKRYGSVEASPSTLPVKSQTKRN